MKEKALEVLKKLSENNYESYLVGGYPRDLILGRKTNDIDICTSATPKEILEIFDDVIVSDMQYGSVVIVYKGCKFDTTTFRKEIKYESNRKPVKIKYIKDIKKDLLRRDFTINTLCIDKDGNPSYKKKNFSGINGDATPEALATVADAIKLVLANQTRYTLVNEISMLEDNA